VARKRSGIAYRSAMNMDDVSHANANHGNRVIATSQGGPSDGKNLSAL